MQKFERWLLLAVALLLAISLTVHYWQINRSLFIEVSFTKAERDLLAALNTDSVARYRINQRLLCDAQSRSVIDHYQWGELVDQIPAGGAPFCELECKNKLTEVYTGFSQESGGTHRHSFHLGIEGMSSWQRFSAPDHEFIRFIAPDKIPLMGDEPMVMSMVVFSDQPIAVDELTGADGQLLMERVSQYPDVFVYTLRLTRESDE